MKTDQPIGPTRDALKSREAPGQPPTAEELAKFLLDEPRQRLADPRPGRGRSRTDRAPSGIGHAAQEPRGSYESHLQGNRLGGAEQARERMAKYAKAYAGGGGTHAPMIAAWVEVVAGS